MKKTILALLITLLVTTPCLAQGVKAEEPAPLDGTLWIFRGGPEANETIPIADDSISFYDGRVYVTCPINGCKEAHNPNFYVSGKKLSLFRAGHRALDMTEEGKDLSIGIMSPLTGIGIMYHVSGSFLDRKRGVGILEKVPSPPWEPPKDVE